MCRLARLSLALALAWAGGFASIGSNRVTTSLVALGLGGLALTWLRPTRRDPSEGTPLTRACALIGLAALLGLLSHPLIELLVAVPSAAFGLFGAGLGAGLVAVLATRGRRLPTVLSTSLVGLSAVLAAFVGLRFEAGSTQGAAHGGPLLGVHPGQAIALRIDGHGPHDILAPDFVEPRASEGLDGRAWATWASDQLHRIAEEHYADGPARARAAYGQARVEARPVGEDGAGVALTILSGTRGRGSSVEVVCPSRSFDPRPARASSRAACPTKYQADGSTGLGLSRRWPGYVEIRGRAFPAWRPLTLLALLGFMLLAAIVWRARAVEARPTHAVYDQALVLLSLASGLALIVALCMAEPRSGTLVAGPGLLALVLVATRDQRAGRERPAALGLTVLMALLLASPLAGGGSAIAIRDGLVERLVLVLGLPWAASLSFTTLLVGLVLALGVGICAFGLMPESSREAEHTSTRGLLLSLAVVCLALLGTTLAGPWLRKDGDFVALLTSAAALHLAATVSAPTRLGRGLLATICASGPLGVVLLRADLAWPPAPHATIALVSALLCLGLGLRRAGPQPGPSRSIELGS